MSSRGEAAVRLGGNNDGGVDAVILLDPLGLDRLYAQAKLLRARLGDVVDLPFKRLRYFAGVCANRAVTLRSRPRG